MLSKNEIKYIQSLCQKKQRQEAQVFVAEGSKIVSEMLAEGYPVKNIYAVRDWADHYRGNLPITVVTPEELSRMSCLTNPHEVIAVAEQRNPVMDPDTADAFTLVLDGIQDPGNFGTIIRIADWFGIRQVVASPDTVELFNPKVIQASMGSFMRVHCWYMALDAFLAAVKVPVYGAVFGGPSLYTYQETDKACLLIGNEGRGIRPDLLPFIDRAVTIPRLGGAESLNAGVAAGIIVSYLKRK